MKELCVFVVAVLCAFSLRAQVQVVQLPGNSLQYALSDWQRFSLVNSSQEEQRISITGLLRTGKGEVLAKFSSGTLVMRPGLNSYTYANLKTSSIEILSAQATGLRSGRSLPPGSYVACINVSSINGKALGSSCQEVGLEPLVMPQLISPANSSSVYSTQPLFSWTPLVQGSDPTGTQYSVALYECRQGQAVVDAASRNRPIFETHNLSETQLMYPTGAKTLKEHKQYVWKVETRYQGQYLGTTELFHFYVNPTRATKQVQDTVWLRLDPAKTLANRNCGGVLRLSHQHFVPKEPVQIRFTEQGGNSYLLAPEQYAMREKSGEILVNLQELDFIVPGTRYKLEVTRQNRQVMKAGITYIK